MWSPRGHSAMSGDTVGCHSFREGCPWYLVGRGQGAGILKCQEGPAPKNCLAKSIGSAPQGTLS